VASSTLENCTDSKHTYNTNNNNLTLDFNTKLDVPNLITYLNRTSIFECIWFGVAPRTYTKKTCVWKRSCYVLKIYHIDHSRRKSRHDLGGGGLYDHSTSTRRKAHETVGVIPKPWGYENQHKATQVQSPHTKSGVMLLETGFLATHTRTGTPSLPSTC
jgi:hypothetical protein